MILGVCGVVSGQAEGREGPEVRGLVSHPRNADAGRMRHHWPPTSLARIRRASVVSADTGPHGQEREGGLVGHSPDHPAVLGKLHPGMLSAPAIPLQGGITELARVWRRPLSMFQNVLTCVRERKNLVHRNFKKGKPEGNVSVIISRWQKSETGR